MQSRCSISSTLASRPLPSLGPPRHTCRWTLPSGTSAGFNFARRIHPLLDSLMQLVKLHKTVQQRVDDVPKRSVQMYPTRALSTIRQKPR